MRKRGVRLEDLPPEVRRKLEAQTEPLPPKRPDPGRQRELGRGPKFEGHPSPPAVHRDRLMGMFRCHTCQYKTPYLARIQRHVDEEHGHGIIDWLDGE